MKTRIISALVMLPLLILVCLGGWPLKIAALLVGLIGLHELYHGFEAEGVKPCAPFGYVATLVLYGLHLLWPDAMWPVMLWLVLAVMGCLLTGFDVQRRTTADVTATLLGLVYVVFFSFHIVLIDETPQRIFIWLTFVTAFGTDIMAYFTGMAIGKHKLCPHLSPKKTVEGAVGGVAGSVLLSLLFGYVLARFDLAPAGQAVVHPYLAYALFGFFGSIAAQLGDLSASALKRKMGIKDYGKLIPGHGGILDRFDSVLFTAPLTYYMIRILFG